jgi:hypothetical protein
MNPGRDPLYINHFEQIHLFCWNRWAIPTKQDPLYIK